MKNIKRVIKSLLVGMVIAVGCLVNGNVANASTLDKPIKDYYTMRDGSVKTIFNDDSFYINSNVEVQSIDKINDTVTFNKDGELYSFFVDKDSIDNYYLSEVINITMDNNNEVVDCIVDIEPIVYSDVSIIYADNQLYCVRIGTDVYSFNSDDDCAEWKVGDKVNVVMQDDEILEVRPYVSM